MSPTARPCVRVREEGDFATSTRMVEEGRKEGSKKGQVEEKNCQVEAGKGEQGERER